MSLHNVKTLRIALVAALITAFILATANFATAGPNDPDFRGKPNSIHAIFEWADIATDWDLTLFETGPSAYPLHNTDAHAFDDGLDSTIILPNFIDPLPRKLVRFQMFFDGLVEGTLIDMQVVGHDTESPVAVEVGRSTDRANRHYIDWLIRPNPDWEEFFIYGILSENIRPGNLLTFEIDTISFVPEPSSMLLFGLGGLALWRLRRRVR